MPVGKKMGGQPKSWAKFGLFRSNTPSKITLSGIIESNLLCSSCHKLICREGGESTLPTVIGVYSICEACDEKVSSQTGGSAV